MTTEANAAASNKAKARAIEAASKIFEANTIQDSHDHDTAIVTSGGLMADIAQLILDHESQVTRLQSALEARTVECAKVADAYYQQFPSYPEFDQLREAGMDIAAAIRKLQEQS